MFRVFKDAPAINRLFPFIVLGSPDVISEKWYSMPYPVQIG